ncbi:MAG TPA: tripartite tricarboxylate transporter substrate binding protein [Burkholderiales bacterium]|jgi:tripartite-type tricarboxylate transporter receptor subunit TctC|nr:tripartite tricarboxylate transporter substrate binding protein [Burkholderiales bacterium]
MPIAAPRLIRTVAVAACAAAGLSAGAAHAQAYPNKPVRIVVPFAAGGPADIYARAVAQYLGDELKQPFTVDDRPGGGSLIGTDIVAKSPPDGYNLLLISNTHTVNETLYQKRPFTLMRDFAPISPINIAYLALVVNPTTTIKSVADLISQAKAAPGKLNYASSGSGTPYHMAGELFKAMAKVDITHVPYKGSSGARTDVIGGQVQMMFDSISTMTPFIKQNKVRGLATTGKQRDPILPDLPTVADTVPGYTAEIWLGLMAPAKTPQVIIDKLNGEIQKMVQTPATRDTWATQGALPMVMTQNTFTKYLNDDIAKWAKVVKISGAKVE